MSKNVITTNSNGPGTTRLAFSTDGSRAYTGGEDCIVRIWDLEAGGSSEPQSAADANDAITWIAAAEDCWLTASKDSEVRRYATGSWSSDELVTTANSVPVRSMAVDPSGRRLAVASDELFVKLIDLEDTLSVTKLEGYTAHVRAVSWHPTGTLLTTCTADGKIVVWDLSGNEPVLEQTIEGIIPVVKDDEALEYSYDCSAVWHPNGDHFYVASKTHEIVTISRPNWSKLPSTFASKEALGAITALAISPNGQYLISACKSRVLTWSTSSKQVVNSVSGTPGAAITQLAFCPKQNLIAWTDNDGGFSRWANPISSSEADPIKPVTSVASVSTTVATPVARVRDELFADDEKMDEDEDLLDDGYDDDIDLRQNFIEDDMDGALNDDEPVSRKVAGSGYVKEMVSITKAQPAFQPGSTPWSQKKRYLAFNMLGVIEATDQDVHQIINVVFYNQTDRHSFHFTDPFKNDLGYLGECGAVFACPVEATHVARVLFKPYSPTAKEWTYDLRPGTSVVSIAAGGMAPKESLRSSSNADLQGYGHVVVATSEHDLTFLTGTGRERRIMAIGGDVVSMVANAEWVFVVHRPGSTTIDGSQNLYYTVINFEDFSVRQRDVLPVPKGHTLKWIGLTEEGLPAMYDSTGYLHVLTKVRIPHHAAWIRILDTNLMDRRAGKEESYWPVGVSGDNFMALILKGLQEFPGFPRPLVQELPIQFPFRRPDSAREEQVERGLLYTQTLLDALDDDLTTPDIITREAAIDKEFILLIQAACKEGDTARALELVKLLHNIPSFDASISIAGFYNLSGLKEKIEFLKTEREDNEDRLVVARNKRRRWMRPDAQLRQLAELQQSQRYAGGSGAGRYDPLGDVRPPPRIERPGMERVTKPTIEKTKFSQRREASPSGMDSFSWEDVGREDSPPPVEKRKRDEVEDSFASNSMPPPKTKPNPFARKAAPELNKNPFARNVGDNKSLHKSESFFDKVDAVEGTSTVAGRKRPSAAKAKASALPAKKQATLADMMGGKKDKPAKKAANSSKDVVMIDSLVEADDDFEETQLVDEDGQTLVV